MFIDDPWILSLRDRYGESDSEMFMPYRYSYFKSEEHNINETLEKIEEIRYISYGVVNAAVISVGILGNLLTIYILHQPQFKGVAYMYFRAIAIADLLSLCWCISFVDHLLNPITHHYSTAVWWAYSEVFLLNGTMSISTLIIVCITVDRYCSVCRPNDFKRLHTAQNARKGIIFSVILSLVLYVPVCALKIPVEAEHFDDKNTFCGKTNFWKTYLQDYYSEDKEEKYAACMRFDPDLLWNRIYTWTRQTIITFIPIIIMVVLNTLLIKEFIRLSNVRAAMRRNSLRNVQAHPNSSPARTTREKDDKHLINLLSVITASFFICQVPSGIYDAIYSNFRTNEVNYEIFRAIANNLEILNHAMNFYIYILCSRPIRQAIRNRVEQHKLSISLLAEPIKNQTVKNIHLAVTNENVIQETDLVRRKSSVNSICKLIGAKTNLSNKTSPSDIELRQSSSPVEKEQEMYLTSHMSNSEVVSIIIEPENNSVDVKKDKEHFTSFENNLKQNQSEVEIHENQNCDINTSIRNGNSNDGFE